MRAYNRLASDKYARLEKALGLADIARTIRELNASLDIPAAFKDCNEVDLREAKFLAVLDRMSENAFADPCTLTNPGKPTAADVKALYTAAYYGNELTKRAAATHAAALCDFLPTDSGGRNGPVTPARR